MKKKIWSIVLSLSMLASFVTAVPAVNAAEGDPTVYIRYYEDNNGVRGEEISSVTAGDTFFAVLSINNFTEANEAKISNAALLMDYDREHVVLYPYVDKNGTAITSNDKTDADFVLDNFSDFAGVVKDTSVENWKNKNGVPGIYGFKPGNVSLSRINGTMNRKRMEVFINEVLDLPHMDNKDGHFGIVLSASAMSDYGYDSEMEFLEARFKALEPSNSEIEIMKPDYQYYAELVGHSTYHFMFAGPEGAVDDSLLDKQFSKLEIRSSEPEVVGSVNVESEVLVKPAVSNPDKAKTVGIKATVTPVNGAAFKKLITNINNNVKDVSFEIYNGVSISAETVFGLNIMQVPIEVAITVTSIAAE